MYRTDADQEPVVTSEVAHIVAQSPDGPRGAHSMSVHERDGYDNLLLLCEEHHRIVDAQPSTYTVEKLRQIKDDHERLIREATGRVIQPENGAATSGICETLFSTLMGVAEMPRYVFSVATDFDDTEERRAGTLVEPPQDRNELCPFLIRGGRLFCFQDLSLARGPFRRLVGAREVDRTESSRWWVDPDRGRWYVTLLNRALNKLTGRKGLNLDKRHHRYYFMPERVGSPLEVRYKPMNASATRRQVVWQPVTKKTG